MRLGLADFLARHEPFDLLLVGALQGEQRHPCQVLEEYRQAHGHPPQSIGIFVGPEGDFTPVEMEAIALAGAHRVTLGSLVLRSDTAAIYCLSVLNYELQAGALP
jgi:16S rRNA (uracil1498-N3)-methyltransferase